jgi:hypothetical protein
MVYVVYSSDPSKITMAEFGDYMKMPAMEEQEEIFEVRLLK